MHEARRVYGRSAALALCATVLLAGAGQARATDRAADDEFWATVGSCTDADEVRLYLKRYPRGRHVAEAKACLRRLGVGSLLRLCASHLAANRLVGPAGRSAAECYRHVLVLDPSNRAARTGLRKIGETVGSRARAALRRGDLAEARRLLGILQRVVPGAPVIAALQREIAAAQQRRRIVVMKPGRQFKHCSACPQMVALPTGSFTMGSPPNEFGRKDREGPRRVVRFRKQFAVGKHEVTFAQWDACEAAGGCGNHFPGDATWGRGNRPVINVSWRDAKRYVRWLSAVTGKPYRLLTEAEWEYAARAGSRTAYGWGAFVGRNRANCKGCGSRWGGRKTARVGSFAKNRFGLHDMHGNVREWVEDCSHGSYRGAPKDGRAWTDSGDCRKRMKRGGSWRDRPERVRAASRIATKFKERDRKTGFRVALTLER
ncbi:MAG: SUMF1/EgtB/PvdO family nonheme iron enzyme [Rhodospirillaceae bacterium]|nr:SUMF1/EgtB/PvdO family nonheme iron enzyme [Rhodospirillaceae bacterium]